MKYFKPQYSFKWKHLLLRGFYCNATHCKQLDAPVMNVRMSTGNLRKSNMYISENVCVTVYCVNRAAERPLHCSLPKVRG